MDDDESYEMEDCVVDPIEDEYIPVVVEEGIRRQRSLGGYQNPDTYPFGVLNGAGRKRKVISIVVNSDRHRTSRQNQGTYRTIGITIDIDGDEDDPFGLNNNQTTESNEITGDVDEDDDPFGIMDRESGSEINAEEDPFDLTEMCGEEFGTEDEFSLSGDEDPIGNDDTNVYDPLHDNDEGYGGNHVPSVDCIGVGMSFDTLEECEFLYHEHAKAKGFSVRRAHKHKNNKGTITLRRWVCSKEGYKQGMLMETAGETYGQRPTTRVGCLASLRVKFEANLNKYIVRDMVEEHNHELAKFGETQYLLSNRSITPADGALIDGFRGVGIKPPQIMDFLCKQRGGYENIGFTTEDLYTYIRGNRNKILEGGDASSALAYLQAKKDADPNFYFRPTKDASNRLLNLFWADGKSRDDYAAFGDVIAFDSTYKTNANKKPFVIFVGVNHHHQTTIFGCALLADETEDSYCWLLETFLEAMGNKLPVSVVTDGDMAMRNAIEKCFPGSRHRLCSWHLHQNAVKNVHEEGFSSAFQTCMANWYTEEEFELAWQYMMNHYKVEKNNWVAETYAKRAMWAEAYLRGIFFVGMRSTQRSEGINGYLNRFLKHGMKLYEFVRQFQRAITRLREREVKAEYESNHGSPVMTTVLRSLEKHGGAIYTKNSFKRFQKELRHEALYAVIDKAVNESVRTYTLSKYCDDNSRKIVTYHEDNTKLDCSCQRFESNGIPCRHMMAVMKAENMEEIPHCVISRRWCKNAKSHLPEALNKTIPEEAAKNVRYGALNAVCNNLSYVASLSKNVYDVARAEIDGLTSRLTELGKSSVKGSGIPAEREVEDPVQVKTKGRPTGTGKKVKKPRKCGTCRSIGHIRTHCPRLGKSPKIKKSKSKRGRQVKQGSADNETARCFVHSKLDSGDKELEDEWEFSNVPSPAHSLGVNRTDVDSKNVDYGCEAGLHDDSPCTNRGEDEDDANLDDEDFASFEHDDDVVKHSYNRCLFDGYEW